LGEDLGRGTQQQVNRWLWTLTVMVNELHCVIGDLDMVIGRHDIDNARLQLRRIECEAAHGEDGVPRENLMEVAGIAWVEMLRQDDRSGEPSGQRRDKR